MRNSMFLTLAFCTAIPAAFSQEVNAPIPGAPANAGQPQTPAVQGGGMMGGGRGGMNQGSLLSDAAKVVEFAEYDTNKDGQLSDDEIAAAKEKVFERFKEEAKKYNKQVLGQYDADKNGKLDDVKKDGKPDSELSVFMKFIAWQEEGALIQKTMLAKFDKDGDGQLTGDEARQAFGPRMEMEYDRNLKTLFKQCDKNNDGKFDEQELAAARELGVKKYDHNGDGKVTDRELFQPLMEAMANQGGMGQWGGRGMRGGNNGGGQQVQPGGGWGGNNAGGQIQPGGGRPNFGGGQVPGGRGGRGAGPGAAMTKEELIKRFDLDGDGKLNVEEQKRADAAQKQQRQDQVIAPPIDE